jgi:hypothetical protein
MRIIKFCLNAVILDSKNLSLTHFLLANSITLILKKVPKAQSNYNITFSYTK